MDEKTIKSGYFTFVNVVIGPYTYNPNYAFQHLFEGMDITYRHICSKQGDSRNLGVWTYNGTLVESEIEQIVSERLSLYGYHKKTYDKAKAYAIECGA